MPINSVSIDYSPIFKALSTILNTKISKSFKTGLQQLRLPEEIFTTGLILLSRLVNLKSRQVRNHEKVFLTCLLLAQQALQDIPYSIKLWSRLTHYSTAQLNRSRWRVFEDLEYSVKVEEHEYFGWRKALKALSI